MTKLLKIFPLSKLAKSPVKLLLSILLYLAINMVVSGVISSAIASIMVPGLIFMYVGIIGIGACVGLIGEAVWLAFILIPLLIGLFTLMPISVTILSYIESFALSIVEIYSFAGIVISFIAYARSEDAQPEPDTEI